MNQKYKKWDVCIANVKYEDMPVSKVRPVLVLGNQSATVLGLKMTSQQPRQGEYVLVQWSKAGLKKPTTVRVSKQLCIQEQDIRAKIGHLTPVDIAGVQKAINDLSK